MNDSMIKAQHAQENKKFQEALDLYTQEIAENPNNALAYQNIALCYYKLGKNKDAISASKKTISIDGSLPIAHLILAEAYGDQKDFAMSKQEIQIAYELSPESSEVLGAYGAFLLINNNINEAIPILEKATKKDPNSYNIHNNLIVAYSQKKDFEKVFIHISEVYRLRPSTYNAIQLIIAYFNRKGLFKVFSALFIVFTSGAVIFKSWALLIAPALFIFALVVVGAYLMVTKKGKAN